MNNIEPSANKTEKISFGDFAKVQIAVGTILSAEINEKAKKPAYKIQIDFGVLGVKNSSAQLTENYTVGDLIGKQVVAVMNFEPKNVAGYMSEVLLLAAVSEEKGTILLTPSSITPNGSHIA